jgi:hypothetical protein
MKGQKNYLVDVLAVDNFSDLSYKNGRFKIFWQFLKSEKLLLIGFSPDKLLKKKFDQGTILNYGFLCVENAK